MSFQLGAELLQCAGAGAAVGAGAGAGGRMRLLASGDLQLDFPNTFFPVGGGGESDGGRGCWEQGAASDMLNLTRGSPFDELNPHQRQEREAATSPSPSTPSINAIEFPPMPTMPTMPWPLHQLQCHGYGRSPLSTAYSAGAL